MKAIIAATFLLASSPAIAAGSIVGFEKGGRFIRFDPVIMKYNMSGELFRIDGICKSACTTFLAIRNVCVTRGATLFFHAGTTGTDSNKHVAASVTNRALGAYNERLYSYVKAHHYMETTEFHAISGSDIIDKFGYPECQRSSRR